VNYLADGMLLQIERERETQREREEMREKREKMTACAAGGLTESN